MGAVDAHHHHRRQSGQFDRHPHQADIVGYQRQVHAEHHHLISGMIELQVSWCEAASFQLMTDVRGAEQAGGEADQRVEHDEYDIEVVHQEIGRGRAAPAEEGERSQKC